MPDVSFPSYPLADLIKEARLGTTSRSPDGLGELQLIKMGSVQAGKIDYSQVETVERESVNNRKLISLRDGDILLNTRNTPTLVGKVGIWRDRNIESVPDNNLMILRVNDQTHPGYLNAQLSHGSPSKRIRALAEGTTSVAAVYWRHIKSLKVPCPSLAEQRRIAEILDTLDEQITAIMKLRQKAETQVDGLFVQLFGMSGEADSEAVQLRDAARWLSGGTPHTGTPEFWDGDIPWISAASMKDFYISSSARNITALGAAAGSRLVPAGTTVCVVRGMSLKNEFRVGVTTREVAFGQDCKALLPADGVEPWYLGYSVRALAARVLVLVDEAGHGTGRLETPLLEKLDIQVPALDVQAEKVRIAQSAEREIQAHDVEIAKLQKLKQALMSDLLTGRVRVQTAAED